MAYNPALDDPAFGPVDNARPSPGGYDPRNDPAFGETKPVTKTSFWQLPSKETVGHAIGVGARDVAEGLGGAVGAVGDVLTWPGRAIGKAIGYEPKPWQQPGFNPLAPVKDQLAYKPGPGEPAFYDAPSTAVQKAIDSTGLPTSQTDTEKVISTINKGATGTLGGGATSIPTLLRVGAQGGAAALAGDAAADNEYVPEWLKPTVRILAGVAGAKAADVGANVVTKGVNAAAGNVSDTYRAFQRVGVEPSLVGTVSGSEGGQSLEAALSRTPFASSVMRPVQQRTVDQFGNAVDRTVAQLNPNATNAQAAGDVVQANYRNFVRNEFPAQEAAAWQPFNQRMAGASVNLAPLDQALAGVNARLGLPNVERVLTPGQTQALREALRIDVPGGVVPIWQAQRIRSAIGALMSIPEYSQAVGMDALTAAYRGASQAIRNTAIQHGQERLFDEANAVSTAGHAFIENVGKKIATARNPALESITPEQATNNLLKSGDTTLQAVRDRIPGAADALAAHKAGEMATAKPSVGAYNDTSTGTFLTNVNRMRQQQPGGYRALFEDNPVVGRQMDDLATVAQRLRETERHLNTSRTAETLGWMDYLNNVRKSEGFKDLALNLFGPPLAGRGAAKVMTNPAVARYVAADRLPPSVLPPSGAGLLGTLPDLQR